MAYKWEHDHSKCDKPVAPVKVYDETLQRYTIHEFVTRRFVAAFIGTEKEAEMFCVKMRKDSRERSNYYYKEPEQVNS
jgi:hypothetical protein